MRAVKWTLRIILAVALLVFVALAPPYLTRALNKNPAREIFEPKGGDWSGIITVWHVVSFKPYQGSVSAYLESCFTSYEKKHSGVYVEVLGMDAAGMQERLDRGERPDLWSFASGALYPEQLSPLQLDAAPEFVSGLKPAKWEGTVYAVPYLYSGYFLIGNTVRTQEAGLAWPGAGEPIDPEFLQSALDMGKGKQRPQLSGSAFLCAQWGLLGAPAPEGDFKAGQVALQLADARACGDLMRKQESGGFTFDALPLSDVTDQVQYIGPDRKLSNKKRAHAEALTALLLENKAQSKVAALGAMPVVAGVEGLTYAEGLLDAMYRACQNPKILDPFLYQRHKDALFEEAARAMTGDAGGKTAFDARLAEIMEVG